jgi:signal peptidase II
MKWQANTGIAFGLFPEFPLWGFFALVFLIFFIMIICKIKFDFAWSLFIGGMCGNFIDRIRFSYVIDWISIPFHFPFIGKLHMNIADIALIMGFLCFVFNNLKKTSHE